MKKTVLSLIAALTALSVSAQTGLKKVYDEDANPIAQIDQAVGKAKAEDKFVVCQVGGNWCPWCLRFADFIARDSTIAKVIDDNFVYIHVNYNPRKAEGEKAQQGAELMKRLDNCGRFGFPVFVVLDAEGRVLHIQDSSFLEESMPVAGESTKGGAPAEYYDQKKVMRFFSNWTPKVVRR
jgi:thioredoxin-related protein